MSGGRYEVPRRLGYRPRRNRWLVRALASAALVALGIAAGSRIASDRGETRVATVTATAPVSPAAPGPSTPTTRRSTFTGYPRTRAGAVAAASAYVSALDGPPLLDPARVRKIVQTIAAEDVRAQLTAMYERAATQLRLQLGVGATPAPVVIVRSAPVGYRVQSFDRSAATVLVWRVGIVGSDTTIQPQQSWRTETVSLVWERGWKVKSFTSERGPTPPVAPTATSPPGDLLASIPRFEEFSRADP